MARMMKALTFVGPGEIELRNKPIPKPGPTEALIRITMTTICGTDIHILKGEYPVKAGLTIGHEPVGIIEELGSEVKGYEVGQRVIVGAITPCGHCSSCLEGAGSQCGGKPMGGWKFGNTIDGAQAEFLLVPDAMANLAVIPNGLSDEQVLLCPDIMSTGFSGAESGKIKIGDSVAIFAQGPIGLCATVGARLSGASLIIAVDGIENRLKVSKSFGADVTMNYHSQDPVAAILQLTEGRGVDVAIEALGTPETLQSCLKVLKPHGTLSSLGVYGKDLTLPVQDFCWGLGDQSLVTTLCPGGKERMRRLMSTISQNRANLNSLITHHFELKDIKRAYDLFGKQEDGVLKIAIHNH